MDRLAETDEADSGERDGDEHQGEAELWLEDALVLPGEELCGGVGHPAGDGGGDQGDEEQRDVGQADLGWVQLVGGRGEYGDGEEGDDEEEGEEGRVDDGAEEHGWVDDERQRFDDSFPETVVVQAAAEEGELGAIGLLGFGDGYVGLFVYAIVI